MNGLYMNDVKWLANYDQTRVQSDNWNMDLRLTSKPKINQLAIMFGLGRKRGIIESKF